MRLRALRRMTNVSGVTSLAICLYYVPALEEPAPDGLRINRL